MYHPALHLELAHELSRERAQHAPAASTTRSRPRILRRLAARTRLPRPTRPRWA
jgi:hypothetical protein